MNAKIALAAIFSLMVTGHAFAACPTSLQLQDANGVKAPGKYNDDGSGNCLVGTSIQSGAQILSVTVGGAAVVTVTPTLSVTVSNVGLNAGTQTIGNVGINSGTQTIGFVTASIIATPTLAAALTGTAVATPTITAKAASGNLISVTGSAVTGSFIMVFNATSPPADGAVTPVKCFGPMPTAGPFAFSWGIGPVLNLSSGIVIVSSSTGCFSKTATNANFISVEYQ